MESSGEGGGKLGLGLGFMEIETGAEGLERSVIFHLVKEILGFVLYMHHQIPAILQHLEVEFDALKNECRVLEESLLTQMELKASSLRQHNGRIREVKLGIRKLEKLMNTISSLLSALQLTLEEVPDIRGVSLILGSSLIRPQHVYEMFFSHGKGFSGSAEDSTKSKVAEALSRKAIRALVSSGAGGTSYSGPTKVFLLVRAPATFNLPLHFLPKRDFRYSKKMVPFKLHIKCRIRDQKMDDSEIACSNSMLDSTSNDMIWFQCRHTVKGLASKNPSEG